MADAIKPIGSQLRGYTQHQQSHKYKQWCETEPTLGGREKWQALFILCKKTKSALLTDWWSKRDISLRSQVNASAPGLLRCRVASPPHGATLELPSWTCCWLSVSQQFHHLSCRDCYSSKSNKDFNQSISNSAEIVNFPARWLMEFITKKKKKNFFLKFFRRSPR